MGSRAMRTEWDYGCGPAGSRSDFVFWPWDGHMIIDGTGPKYKPRSRSNGFRALRETGPNCRLERANTRWPRHRLQRLLAHISYVLISFKIFISRRLTDSNISNFTAMRALLWCQYLKNISTRTIAAFFIIIYWGKFDESTLVTIPSTFVSKSTKI